MFQIHLNRPGMSGRAVRCETLSTKEIEAAELAAANCVTKDSKMAEYNNAVLRLGMEMMIRQVTEKVDAKDLPEAKWQTVGAQELSLTFAKLFNVRDTAALKAAYLREHTVSAEDIEAIMDAKIQVLED